MKPETILNAHEEALLFGYEAQGNPNRQVYERRIRQARAFRSRILRMFAEKDAELTRLRAFRNERLSRALDEFSKENF